MNINWSLARRRPALEIRARIIQSIRQYFIQEGFLEVETPFRIPAPAPESYIDAIPSGNWFMQTSPELCMKRLLAAGYERIFQVCHCWREGERGGLHIPEFTMLEWYRAEANYCDLMNDCRLLLSHIVVTAGINRDNHSKAAIRNLEQAWERLTVREAFNRYSGQTMEEALYNDSFDELMTTEIEPRLGKTVPTFLCDYPAERGALARLSETDPTVAERIELYIDGTELANGFSELIDSDEQRRRFAVEERYRRSLGRIPYPDPSRFLEELPSMPPSAGIALGIDRLVMVLSNAKTIDEVVAFTPEEL